MGVIYSKGAIVQSWLLWGSLFVYYIESKPHTIMFNVICDFFLGLTTKILHLLILLGFSRSHNVYPSWHVILSLKSRNYLSLLIIFTSIILKCSVAENGWRFAGPFYLLRTPLRHILNKKENSNSLTRLFIT